MTQIHYKNKKIVAFSDTHGKHRGMRYINADIVLFLGDACDFGNSAHLKDFFEWFKQYPAKHKLFVAGNHELQWQFEPDEFLNFFPKNCIFLENRFIKIEGITFVSVPATMGLLEYPELKVPEKVDFLLTHAPPYGILDINMGCSMLLKYVSKLKPRNHLFGHIHETGGKFLEIKKTIFNNVSVYHQLDF